MATQSTIQPLDIDFEAYGRERAGYERALLDTVRTHKMKARASLAAVELLRWHARFGQMEAPDVQQAIEDGHRIVAALVATDAMNLKSSTAISPLTYFGRRDANSRSGGPKVAGAKTEFLLMRSAFGDRMTRAEAYDALTEQGEVDGPDTVELVESTLMDHLLDAYKDADDKVRRDFVRSSFPDIPWGRPEATVTYRDGWLTCAS